jgi:hypothetical protein
MPFIRRIGGDFGTLTVALVVVALSNGAAVAANATGAASKNSAPIRLNPNASELSPSALGMDDHKGKLDRADEQKSAPKIPDHIEFGETVLHFDTSRKNPIPLVGVDANDQAVNKAAPDGSPLKSSYFGLRFTAPLH